MTDPTSRMDTSAATEFQRRGMPRWVKVSLLVVVALIGVFVILSLLGVAPGDHGPTRHVPGGGAPASTAPEHGPGMHDR